jgi:hypothetical protein
MPLSQEIADYATAAGVIVALALGIRSDSLTRRGQKAEQEFAARSAERAEAAARTADGYTERVLEALEQIAAGPPPPRVRWKLEHLDGDMYLLTNTGDAVATRVQMLSHSSLPLHNRPAEVDIDPDGTWTFLAAPSLATSDYTITVAWRDEDSVEERTWQYPLPPKDMRRELE